MTYLLNYGNFHFLEESCFSLIVGKKTFRSIIAS